MNQETTLGQPPLLDINIETRDFRPMNDQEAIEYVGAFRYLEPNAHSFGVIHRKEYLLDYLNNHYDHIKSLQPKEIPADYVWGVGHFFMRRPDGETGFCVAPVLFKPDETKPGRADVLDPFDPKCTYQYTFGLNPPTNVSAVVGDDVNEQVYDMGEMWP